MKFTFYCWHQNEKKPVLEMELDPKFWFDFNIKHVEQEVPGDFAHWFKCKSASLYYLKDSMLDYRIHDDNIPSWKYYVFYCDCNGDYDHNPASCDKSKHILLVEAYFDKNKLHRNTGPATIRYSSSTGDVEEEFFYIDDIYLGSNLPFTCREDILNYYKNNKILQ